MHFLPFGILNALIALAIPVIALYLLWRITVAVETIARNHSKHGNE